MATFRVSIPTLGRGLAAVLILSPMAAAQQWQETTLNTATGVYPVDCATTPNNNRAAVRYAGPTASSTILSVWDLVPSAPAQLATFGGPGLKPGNLTTVAPFNLRAYQPSDRIELTNTIGMSIGSGDSGAGLWSVPDDETYVEFFDMSATPPAFLTQYVFTSTSQPPAYDYDHFGLANDLAISRDGDWAVVSSDNWIHVFFLGQFPAAIAWYPFNIGGFDYENSTAWNRPCSPNLAVDSVAMTNERAVVTTARLSTTFTNTYTTWVYIVDLTSGTPTISLQQEIVPTGWNPQGEDYDRPHDIAITSAKLQDRYAIVTTTHGVAAFDLTNDRAAGKYFNAEDWRRYQQQVDSVEVTDEDVLTIADNIPTNPPSQAHWQVRRFKLNPAAGGLSLYASDQPTPSAPETHAHDLAIDLGFDKAIVRADFENVCYTGLDTTTPSYVVVPSSSDSWAFQQFRLPPISYNIFSSDAAVISPETNGQIWAATIGGYVDSVTGLWTGLVDLIDLNAPTVPVQPVIIAPNTSAASGCVPVDLAVSANHTEIVVRSADPYVETSPATGPDLVRISLTGGAAIRYGGSGTVMGLDSLAAPQLGFIAVAKRILSISEQEGTSAGDDYTHVNR